MTKTEKRKRLQALKKSALHFAGFNGRRVQMEAGGDMFGHSDSKTGCGLLDNANLETNNNWDGSFIKWSDIPSIIPENYEVDVYVYSLNGFGQYADYELEFNVAMNIGDDSTPPYFWIDNRKRKVTVINW